MRHSAVALNAEQPAQEWPLSADGRSRARALAPQLAAFQPTRIIASTEQKATETGQILAAELDLAWETAVNLHEHDRRGVPFLPDPAAFQAQVAALLTHPDELVFGRETAVQARDRFTTAVHQLLTTYLDDTLAIVSHGTVITLFLNRYNAHLEPVAFWRELTLPCCLVVSLPAMHLETAVYFPTR